MGNKIIKKACKYVNNLLLPFENHYYHWYGHALEVMERATYLGEKEGLNEKEIEMIGLAGLFHDTGFIIQYDNNEGIGAAIAKNYLKSILYPKNKIKVIEELILATDQNYKNPKNIMEKVIKDADLDNLGTDKFFKKGNDLRKELKAIKKIKILESDWYYSSLDLLYEHTFYTKTQNNERADKKQENTKELEKIIKQMGNKSGKKANGKIKIKI